MPTSHKSQTEHEKQGSLRSYAIGFALSLFATVTAYALVVSHVDSSHSELSHRGLSFAILGLAIVQLIVQVVFFLHLGRGTKPRWNLMAFLFMILVVFIVVAGSIWIMSSLDYNMTPNQVEEYIFNEERIDPR